MRYFFINFSSYSIQKGSILIIPETVYLSTFFAKNIPFFDELGQQLNQFMIQFEFPNYDVSKCIGRDNDPEKWKTITFRWAPHLTLIALIT